jgi:hypothetical protein
MGVLIRQRCKLDAKVVDDGKSAVQENVAKNRLTAEMEIYQFAVQKGYLPNKHRLAATKKKRPRIGLVWE